MVKPTLTETALCLELLGADKFWALKSRLIIPLEHIIEVSVERPHFGKNWWQVLKAPGTHWPGIITAGTYYYDKKRGFWDIHRPEQAVILSLRDEYYDEVVVEVADPIGFASELAILLKR